MHPERKIIQIAATAETESNYKTIIALCNDGTLWTLKQSSSVDIWQLLEPIPQDSVDEIASRA